MTPFTARILEWMDGFYDPASGLLGYPSQVGSHDNPYQQPGVPIVRESTSYAVGLLARDGPGDRERAERCLRGVLAHQVIRPGSAAHGTFRRSPAEPVPGDVPREWLDYDPNWREFIGTTFAVLLDAYEQRLPGALVADLERSLRLAIDGTRARRVPAEYTNIALMCAFLLDWTGRRLNEPSWREEALALAEAVRRDYLANGAFPEHNSPTYYGIGLYGLALWRARAPSARLRAWGDELEQALWRDLARFYHPGLRNLCGPYTRAYGMDMNRYVASLALWIAAAEPDLATPLPAPGPDVDHAHDFCKAPLVEELGSRPPSDVRRALAVFEGPRQVEQIITEHPRRVATAWLAPDLMLGGEHTGGRFVHWQHHPATIHWRGPNGRTSWIRLRSNAPVDAIATPGRLAITVHTGLRLLREAEIVVWLEVDAGPEAAPLDFDSESWALPGLDLRLGTEPSRGAPQRDTQRDTPPRFGWRFAPGEAPDKLELTLAATATH